MAIGDQARSYHNLVELPVNEAGNYVSKYPIEIDEAIDREFPKSYLMSKVLKILIKHSVSYTFMSGKVEQQPFQMSTTEIGIRANTSQSHAVEAIQKLKTSGWLEIIANGKGKASSYLVNFSKVTTAVCTYHELVTDKTGKTRRSERRTRTRSQRRSREGKTYPLGG